MWSRSCVASLGKSNCSSLPKFIWIVIQLSFEFSLLAFARRSLVHFILPAFSLFPPFSSYWISMIVEVHTSFWGIKHAENCNKAMYCFKVVPSRMHLYLTYHQKYVILMSLCTLHFCNLQYSFTRMPAFFIFHEFNTNSFLWWHGKLGFPWWQPTWLH